MKKAYLFFIIFIVAVNSLCSCGTSKTDDNKVLVNHASLLLGTWEGEENGKTTSFTFNEDGTGLVINAEKKEIAIKYTIVSDTQLDIEYDIDGEIIDNVSTYKLDGDTLTLDEVEFVKQ